MEDDIFPTNLLATPPVERRVSLEIPDVVTFNFSMEDDHRLVFKSKPPQSPMEWKNGKLLRNFTNTFNKSHCPEQRFQPDEVDFSKLMVRYSRLIRPLHNTDVRLSYTFHGGTTFLVESFFTFGQRTVLPEERHVVQTTATPVLFYRYDPGQEGSIYKKNFRQTDRRFHQHDECLYDRFVMRPGKTFAVPPGTTYLLLTLQKTLMRVWKESCHARDDYASTKEEKISRQLRIGSEEVAVYLSGKRKFSGSAKKRLKKSTTFEEQPSSSGQPSSFPEPTSSEQQQYFYRSRLLLLNCNHLLFLNSSKYILNSSKYILNSLRLLNSSNNISSCRNNLINSACFKKCRNSLPLLGSRGTFSKI